MFQGMLNYLFFVDDMTVYHRPFSEQISLVLILLNEKKRTAIPYE